MRRTDGAGPLVAASQTAYDEVLPPQEGSSMKRGLLALSAVLAAAVAVPATAALPVGSKAPDFTAKATLAGKPFDFALKNALKKGPVVLYFFPAAFTPGCTIEAHEFAEATPEFNKMGATVIGLSADPIDKLNKFSVEECRNKFAVGSATPAIVSGYDVPLKMKAGLTDRTSYVIGQNGKIVFVHSAMSPAGHVTGTMGAVKSLHGTH
jgi:peroxiredoxin Q/BCP